MSAQRKIEYDEAIASGNSADDPDAEWIDYASLGVDGEKALRAKGLEVLRLVDFGDDLFKLGLRQKIDPAARPELAAGILAARRRIAEVLRDQGAQDLVRQYKSDESTPIRRSPKTSSSASRSAPSSRSTGWRATISCLAC